MTTIDSALLGDKAHAILVADLEARGNVISVLHRNALRVLVGAMADYAAGTLHGRHAVALPTGMGKTSAVVAFILAAEELGYLVPVAVATSKVGALCSIKAELLARGVPEERIGLKHRRTVGEEVTLPSTGDADRLYMLVTHSRVNLGNDYELFGRHKGRDRALMVWDESLMRSESVSIDSRTLAAATASMAALATDAPAFPATIGYLQQCMGAVELTMAELRERGDPNALGAELTFPDRSTIELANYAATVMAVPRLPFPFKEAGRDFLAVSQEPLRLVSFGTSEGVIWSRECVPELLRNVLVLDASYPIRSLLTLDKGMVEITTYPAEALKRFDDVKVVQLMAAGGRNSIASTRRQKVAEQDAVVAEAIAICKAEWATSRGILVFSFKANGKFDPDHLRDIRAGLRAQGLDPDQLIDIGERGADGLPVMKAKLQGLTFGQETSLNGMEFCDVVILAGVLHRSELDIAAAMKGQMGNLAAPTPGWKVAETVQSEVAHICYQALSRGSCRRITDGRAHPMTAYLVHRSKALKAKLDAVMPGASWEQKTPTYLKPAKGEDVAADSAVAIIDHLRKVQEGIDSVSCRSVSEALKVEKNDGAAQAFKRGGKLLDELGSEWAKVGVWFKRGSSRHGFTDQSLS